MPEPVDVAPSVTLPIVQQVTPVEYLVRASLDLRGVRPTAAELQQVMDDPTLAPSMVDGFTRDSRFGRRIAAIFTETFLTFLEEPFVNLEWYEEQGFRREDLIRSIGQEPLEMLAHIADEDLSYAELVTGDWTMANQVLGDIWPVVYTGDGGWMRSKYTDGRPNAGVLASNGMWWQYGSMLNNLNRGRANAYSRIFLCQDYLDHEIGFNPDRRLDSEDALSDAIRVDPACTSCHDSLDPIAAHFYGFWYFSGRKKLPSEIAYYHPEREREWRQLGGLPPAYRGEPTTGLADLGRRTAADPRYARCFVERSFEGMLRRDLLDEERPLLDEVTQRFVDGGLNIRELYRTIVASTPYLEGGGEIGRKVASPSVLGSQVNELTGFSLTRRGLDLMRAPRTGFPALAGGVDGVFRSVRADEPVTTVVLTQKRLAELAAVWVATEDLRSDDPLLLTMVDADTRVDTDRSRMVAQLQELHMRILSESVEATDSRIVEELGLWDEAFAASNLPAQAWAAVVALLLQDPRLVVY